MRRKKDALPDRLRVGYWRPGVHGGPFFHAGWYENRLPDDAIAGSRFAQSLEEGEVIFYLNVLYRSDLPRRLEHVICLESGDRAALAALWEYEGWNLA